MRPLVLIHGYSATGLDFKPLRDALNARLGQQAVDINICNYVSLNNEVTIRDIAAAFDRALRHRPGLQNGEPFDAIVHSTGMLVLRSWLTSYGGPAANNKRLQRVKHIVGLAPATWGSPQAHKGRTWLGALVKGNRQIGPDFLNAGDMVLDGLELGSAFTWDLAHVDLLGPQPFYDKGENTPWACVFIGNTHYSGLAAVANDPGTDGTVRWAGCSLNTRKIRVDLTREPVGADGKPAQRVTISHWANDRLDVPMIAVNNRNHGSLVSDPEPEMTNLIVDFLKIGDAGGETHEQWLRRAVAYSDRSTGPMRRNPGAAAAGVAGEVKTAFEKFAHIQEHEMDGWQQFVVRCIDDRGYGVTDYIMEVLTPDEDGKLVAFPEMYTDVHAYGADQSFRCFHIRLPKGITDPAKPLMLRLHASTGTELMTYQGYGDAERTLTAESEPLDLDLTEFSKGSGTLFFPFTTTLVEILLNREPRPLNQLSNLMTWL